MPSWSLCLSNPWGTRPVHGTVLIIQKGMEEELKHLKKLGLFP